MVLQNKYKARASKRYNAARGGISDSRGRGGAGSSRGGRGERRLDYNNTTAFPGVNGRSGEEGDGSDDDDEEEAEEGQGSGDEVASSSVEKVVHGQAISGERGKYSRRKLESNAWRYQEEEVDPHLGE